MKKIIFTLLLIGACWNALIYAQEFSITGDLRARGEYNNGYGQLRPSTKPDDPGGFVTERARLGLFYNNKGEKLKFGLVIQDTRTWGATGQIQIGDYNNFFLHEAYGEILFTDQFAMKIGRQELNYDDARILGNLDWLMQGRAHDVLLLKYENPKLFTLHLGGGYNALGNALFQQPYFFPTTVGNGGVASATSNWKTMQYLWLHKDFSEKFTLSFLLLNNGVERSYLNASGALVRDVKVDFSQTIGFRATSLFSKVGFGWNANLYYQTGKVNAAGVARNLDAWNALAELHYTIKGFKVLAGFEFLSGNKSTNLAGKTNFAFNPLYGTNHKFNGYMDYFYIGGRYNNRHGLWDPYLTLSYAQPKWNVMLTGHFFSAAAEIYSANQKLKSYLGTELDLTAEYKLTGWLSFQGGFSTMFASKTMPIAINQPNGAYKKFNHWAFVGVVIKPVLFKHTFVKS